MTMVEVLLATIGFLLNKVSSYRGGYYNKINEVFEGGASFYKVDSNIPQHVMNIIEHPDYTFIFL